MKQTIVNRSCQTASPNNSNGHPQGPQQQQQSATARAANFTIEVSGLMVDKFGNFVVKTLFEHAPEVQLVRASDH
eukprot:5616635-Amphidinium_carterae.1